MQSELLSQPDWDARLNHMVSTLVSAGIISAEASSDMREVATSTYHKVNIADSYWPASVLPASTNVTLIRASDNYPVVKRLGEDYGLSAVYDGQVDVHVVQSTHVSLVTDDDNSTQVAHLFDNVLSGETDRNTSRMYSA